MTSPRAALTAILDDPAPFLEADDPSIRRVAVAAALTFPDLHARLAALLTTDSASAVRRECAEVLGLAGTVDSAILEEAVEDESTEVREAAVTALGEIAAADAVDRLIACAESDDEDNIVREAAVAALGAIGAEEARPALLRLVSAGVPQVRRRCVVALTVFDGPEVEAALRAAAKDRNPMVREAAEMVVGRTAE